MAMMGLRPEDLDDESIELMPENLVAANTFIAMSTQWRCGMGGPTGLDYAALPAVLRLQAIPRAAWSDTFECLRVMEAEALRVIHAEKPTP